MHLELVLGRMTWAAHGLIVLFNFYNTVSKIVPLRDVSKYF